MKTKVILNISGGLLFLFACITLFMSTSIILDLFGIREKQGNYVLFIVLANFFCSILYIIASYGFFSQKIWTSKALRIAIVLLILSFIGFVIYIYVGGDYEVKTIYALIFRLFISLIFLYMAKKFISKKPSENQFS